MLQLGFALNPRTAGFIKKECLKRKRSLLFLLFLTIIGTFLELLGIGMIFPILLIKINPEIVTSHRFFKVVVQGLNISDINILVRYLIGIMVLAFFFRNLHLMYLTYVRSKMLGNWREDIARDLLQYYLRAPYPYIINKTSSAMIRNVQITSAVFDRVVISIISLISNFILIFAIVSLVAFIQPVITIVSSLALFGVIIIQNRFLKKSLINAGDLADEGQHSSKEALQQSLSVIRETRLMGKSGFFVQHFITNYKKVSKSYVTSQVLKSIPPLVTQFLMVAVIGGMLLLLITADEGSAPFPSLGLMAMAAFRLAPRFNNIQAAFNTMHEGSKAVEKIAKEFEDISKVVAKESHNVSVISMKNYIELESVSFSYTEKIPPILNNVNLKINSCDFVAIMGESGAGKSTLIDIVTGLLPPTDGQAIVDGLAMIEGDAQRLVRTGFVSQTPFFTNDSIKRNLALGTMEDEICDNRVNEVLEMVGLSDVISNLPEGINTPMGDNAGRFSGGQRQRLAIARALYMKPKLLVLDEPTSALDPETEKQILLLLKEMNKLVTIIIITHRLSITPYCNKILFLDDGIVNEAKTAKELALKNDRYKSVFDH